MPIQSNDEILAAAIEGLEAKKDAIGAQIRRVRQMMTGESSKSTTETARGRRTMSPAARKRLSDLMRKRWATARKSGVSVNAPASANTPKRRLSLEGRRRIIEATKKRWAAIQKSHAKASK